ncbi:replication initiation protein [Pseudomonas luteola]|uniref:hypothetical protein n=1 Tax=Pseudomonas luteola TaxID=47886 RepID=UPI003A8BB915
MTCADLIGESLKRRVIDPAVAQINEYSPLILTWDQRKTGRKVTHLIFDYVNRPWFPRHSPSSENSVSHTLLETAA